MSTSRKSQSIFSTRRLHLAGLAALVGCAACCAVPLVAAAGIGGGTLAAFTSLLRPGAELVVGGGTFLAALGVMAFLNPFKRGERSECGATCKVDGTCCDRGHEGGAGTPIRSSSCGCGGT